MENKRSCLQLLKENLLVVTTLLGAAVGFSIGFGVRSLQPSEDAIMWIGKYDILLYKITEAIKNNNLFDGYMTD